MSHISDQFMPNEKIVTEQRQHRFVLVPWGILIRSILQWRKAAAAFLACAAISPITLSANLLENGSFESGQAGIFFQVGVGSSAIAPWRVTSGNIDVTSASTDQYPQEGERLIDIDGFYQAGAIEQDFASLAGSTYLLSFYMSGNPVSGFVAGFGTIDPVKRIRISIGDQVTEFTHDISSGFSWDRQQVLFTATSNLTTLQVESLSVSNSAFGAYLDNFSVTSTTEPVPDSSQTGLLLLFGVTGLFWTSRKLRGQYL